MKLVTLADTPIPTTNDAPNPKPLYWGLGIVAALGLVSIGFFNSASHERKKGRRKAKRNVGLSGIKHNKKILTISNEILPYFKDVQEKLRGWIDSDFYINELYLGGKHAATFGEITANGIKYVVFKAKQAKDFDIVAVLASFYDRRKTWKLTKQDPYSHAMMVALSTDGTRYSFYTKDKI